MKKITVKLEKKDGAFPTYKIVALTNAATLAFKSQFKSHRGLSIGDVIEEDEADAFARDRRWTCTIVPAAK